MTVLKGCLLSAIVEQPQRWIISKLWMFNNLMQCLNYNLKPSSDQTQSNFQTVDISSFFIPLWAIKSWIVAQP